MTHEVSRRDWLKGGTVLAGALLMGNRANAQDMAVPGFVPTPENPIRLNSNENPYGVSRAARNGVIKELDTAHLYGRGRRMELTEHIAKMEGVGIENIAFAAGSGETLKVMALIAAMEGGAVLTVNPTYGGVVGYSNRRGIKTISVPVAADMSIDLDAVKAAYTDEVSLIYLCNPNNPLPTIIEKNKFKEFCIEMSKKCMVLIDEAYHEYVNNPDYETMIPLAVENDNILVTRTASKIHGFAGVRVGIAFSTEKMIEKLKGYMTGSVSRLAISGAVESYKDTKTQDFIKRKNQESLKITYALFDKHNVNYIKSNANFVFYETGIDIKEVHARFLKHGVRVGRPFPPFLNWCRLTMGKPEDMEYFIKIFEKEFVNS